jgi:hypothetical protein
MVTDVVLCRSGPRLESLCRGLDDSRSVAGSARLVARCTLGKSNKGIDTTVTTGKHDQRGTIEGDASSQELGLSLWVMPMALWGENWIGPRSTLMQGRSRSRRRVPLLASAPDLAGES